jgi:hypothetical protein
VARRSKLNYAGGALLLLTLFGCPRTNWTERYRYDERQPFDLYALYELLEDRPEGLVRLDDTTSLSVLDSATGANYLFVGHSPYYGEEAVTGLLDFVERGNTAFIAAHTLPEDLAYHLFGDDCYYESFEDFGNAYHDPRFPTVRVDSVTAYRYPRGDSFHLIHVRYWDTVRVQMNVISDRLLCDEKLDNRVLGVLDTLGINFLQLSWGEGNFYFHSNPVYFTNWFVLDSLQYRYPEELLAVVAEGPIYWDEYHRRYRQPPTTSGSNPTPRQYTGGRNLLDGNRTLQYIQERRELALAWYLLVIGTLLFVIYRGRRRQRIIPILAPRENSSRRFIETIGRLVYQNANHAALAQRELVSLRFHLNRRFGLAWSEGQPPPGDLAERMGLDPTTVERALTQIRVVTNSKQLGEGDLLRFYRAIDPLYHA